MKGRLLVCTDLDGTLLASGSKIESPQARFYFAQIAARPEVTLAYVTGRHKNSIEQAIRDYQLPNPDWVIGDVGTTLYRVGQDKWQFSDLWQRNIAIDWGELTAPDLHPLFIDMNELQKQEESKQNRYKLSYYVPVAADIKKLKHDMAVRLSAHNVNASLIYSVGDDAEIGLLDVVPKRATKCHAVEFLMQQEGFDYTNTVFAGDSGNDLPVLASAIQSILVANAAPDVVLEAEALARSQNMVASFYHAQGNFLGMNGNFSAGIVEGIAHYFPASVNWLSIKNES
jgi:sucrose-6F-phosphate phosphohydrolase